MAKKRFPHYKQMDQMDCGATCLRIIFKYYGQQVSIHKIRKLCQTTNIGVSLLGISEAAEKLGFRSYGVKINVDQLKDIELPAILHWNQNHFVVLYKIKNEEYYISDPASGLVCYTMNDFLENWLPISGTASGLVLLLSPGPDFNQVNEDQPVSSLRWIKIFSYFYKYKKLFFQVVLGMLVGTVLQLITPFLTQSLVDIGINTKNLGFVNLILIAQLMVFIGTISVSFIRSWLLLHISTE